VTSASEACFVLISGVSASDKRTPAQYPAEIKHAIERGWIALHESVTYLKLTQAGAELFA
jgi:hypothetical protein